MATVVRGKSVEEIKVNLGGVDVADILGGLDKIKAAVDGTKDLYVKGAKIYKKELETMQQAYEETINEMTEQVESEQTIPSDEEQEVQQVMDEEPETEELSTEAPEQDEMANEATETEQPKAEAVVEESTVKQVKVLAVMTVKNWFSAGYSKGQRSMTKEAPAAPEGTDKELEEKLQAAWIRGYEAGTKKPVVRKKDQPKSEPVAETVEETTEQPVEETSEQPALIDVSNITEDTEI